MHILHKKSKSYLFPEKLSELHDQLCRSNI